MWWIHVSLIWIPHLRCIIFKSRFSTASFFSFPSSANKNHLHWYIWNANYRNGIDAEMLSCARITNLISCGMSKIFYLRKWATIRLKTLFSRPLLTTITMCFSREFFYSIFSSTNDSYQKAHQLFTFRFMFYSIFISCSRSALLGTRFPRKKKKETFMSFYVFLHTNHLESCAIVQRFCRACVCEREWNSIIIFSKQKISIFRMASSWICVRVKFARRRGGREKNGVL